MVNDIIPNIQESLSDTGTKRVRSVTKTLNAKVIYSGHYLC